jgi:hypothetical protein
MNKMSVPGVCAIGFVPTVGYSDHANSPINVASRKIYSDVRHMNSGYANYDPVDLMIYLVAMDSCYMILEFMKRAYGVMRLVSPVNRYLPVSLITAMGLDYNSLNSNLDDFRAAINTYAQKLKSLVIPNGMSYMRKHAWMCEGIYQDHPTDKSQMYLFVPDAFFKFVLDQDGAGMLKSVQWMRSTPYTFAQCVTFMNDLLDPLLANQDFAIISGDILKWRGEGGVKVPNGITETYQVFPTFRNDVLDIIQNATLLGAAGLTDYSAAYSPADPSHKLEVRQDANKQFLISTPWFRHPYQWNSDWANPGRNAYMVKRLINFDHDGITPEETLDASRLTNIASEVRERSDTGYDWFKVTTLDADAATRLWFYYYGEDSNGVWKLQNVRIDSISQVDVNIFDSTNVDQDALDAIAQDAKEIMLHAQLISNFNRHPAFCFTTGVLDSSGTLNASYGRFQGYMSDINYYSIVDVQDLEQMSETSLMSEFSVRMQEL